MAFKRRWVLATVAFTLIGAASSALFYFLTGWPVFAAGALDVGPFKGPGSSATVEIAATASFGFAVLRFPEALLLGLAWALWWKRRPALLIGGAILIPAAVELLCGLFPLSASWVGDLAVSMYYYRQPPEYVLPLSYTARVALAFLGPPVAAGLLSLVLLSRIERRVPQAGGAATA